MNTNKVLIAIVVILALFAGLYYWDKQRDDEDVQVNVPSQSNNTNDDNNTAPATKTYTNEASDYTFTYPASWNAVTSQADANEALFGPGATSVSGQGGVEVLGDLKTGQILQAFVKEFNAGIQSGATSETSTTINGRTAVVTIMPAPGNREVKSVAFQNGNKVYSVYIAYTPDNKAESIAEFDKLIASFKFTN